MHRVKGFFKGDPKTGKVQVKLERGDPADVDELRLWYSAPSFTNLNERGQEAFFKFLRGYCYPEDVKVIHVPATAEGMEGDARRYQFWLKCENIDLNDLFDTYVVDDETKIKDVTDSFQAREEIKGKAKEVDSYVSVLKDKMKPDLDNQFSKFKNYLIECEKRLNS